MIPKELIYDTSIMEKRVILFSYFYLKRGIDDTVGFSCDNIVEWCGHSVDYHKNKINEQVTTAILNLAEKEYMIIKDKINRNYYSMSALNIEKFDIDSQFAMIYLDEIEKIRYFKTYIKKTTKMNSGILLLVLSYIRVNLLRRQGEYYGKESDKPEFCYRMYIDIEKDIGISNRYISRAVKILNELDLIVSQELPRYKDDCDNWHTGVTLFVNKYRRDKNGGGIDSSYDYKKELEWGMDYIDNKKYLSRKFHQEI